MPGAVLRGGALLIALSREKLPVRVKTTRQNIKLELRF